MKDIVEDFSNKSQEYSWEELLEEFWIFGFLKGFLRENLEKKKFEQRFPFLTCTLLWQRAFYQIVSKLFRIAVYT